MYFIPQEDDVPREWVYYKIFTINSEKGFVPRVNGCEEYIAVANMAIT
jgi:hypothetical protein